MSETASGLPVILVTGGTSGLGLEIVKTFLRRGYYVIATGRKDVNLPGFESRFRLYKVDFSDMQASADVIREICDNHQMDIVINNAGILSPPDFVSTRDANEYTFQINFLVHLLINEIIIQKFGQNRPLRIAAITSMVYKLARTDLSYCTKKEDYSPVKAYSDSKFFLALMCKYLSAKYADIDLKCFSIDPGVFSSAIYRMQRGWFRLLYRIAAPFMRQPSSVACVLADILGDPGITCGTIYNIRRKERHMRKIETPAGDAFWEECYSILKPYLY